MKRKDNYVMMKRATPKVTTAYKNKKKVGWHHIKTDIAWKKAAKKIITNSVTIGSVAKKPR